MNLLRFFIFLGMFLLFTACNNNKLYQSLSERELIKKNNIKRQMSYNATEDSILHLTDIKTFNEQGYVVNHTVFNLDSTISNYIIFEYDTNNNVVKEIGYQGDSSLSYTTVRAYNKDKLMEEVFYDAVSRIVGQTKNRYDAKGNKIETISYNHDGSTYIYTSEYDANNKEIKGMSYNHSGELQLVYIYKYDLGGNLVEVSEHTSNGAMINIMLFKYDKNGNETELLSKKADGSINFKVLKKYNKNNLITEIVNSGEAGDANKSTFEYDKENRLIKESIYFNNKEVQVLEKAYNKEGLLIKETLNNIADNYKTIKKYNYN